MFIGIMNVRTKDEATRLEDRETAEMVANMICAFRSDSTEPQVQETFDRHEGHGWIVMLRVYEDNELGTNTIYHFEYARVIHDDMRAPV